MHFHKTILVFSRNSIWRCQNKLVNHIGSQDGKHHLDITHHQMKHAAALYSACFYILLCFLCWGGCCSWRGIAKRWEQLWRRWDLILSPLMVECFGVWIPFTLKTLCIIADRTTPCSATFLVILQEKIYSNNFLLWYRWTMPGWFWDIEHFRALILMTIPFPLVIFPACYRCSIW